jgi:hypothetical protein
VRQEKNNVRKPAYDETIMSRALETPREVISEEIIDYDPDPDE